MLASRFGVVVTVLVAILGVELIVIAMQHTAEPLDVLGGLFVTLVGMGAALLLQAGSRSLLRRARPSIRSGTSALVHTGVALYALYVSTSVGAPFGWLLGTLFGAIIGAALPLDRVRPGIRLGARDRGGADRRVRRRRGALRRAPAPVALLRALSARSTPARFSVTSLRSAGVSVFASSQLRVASPAPAMRAGSGRAPARSLRDLVRAIRPDVVEGVEVRRDQLLQRRWVVGVLVADRHVASDRIRELIAVRQGQERLALGLRAVVGRACRARPWWPLEVSSFSRNSSISGSPAAPLSTRPSSSSQPRSVSISSPGRGAVALEQAVQGGDMLWGRRRCWRRTSRTGTAPSDAGFGRLARAPTAGRRRCGSWRRAWRGPRRRVRR